MACGKNRWRNAAREASGNGLAFGATSSRLSGGGLRRMLEIPSIKGGSRLAVKVQGVTFYRYEVGSEGKGGGKRGEKAGIVSNQ